MKTIILKDLMEHIKSVQFIILLCFAVILFTTNGLIFVKKTNLQLKSYEQTKQNTSTVSTKLTRHPAPLLFISEGGDTYRSYQYTLSPRGALSSSPNEKENYTLPDIPEIDWAFIISIIFSLYVILLGYNSISGEREQRTLSLILSNPVGRIKLLVSKYLTIILVVSLPLITGILISLIITGLSTPIIFSGVYISSIALMILLSLVYLSIFTFLSLLFSSLISNSSLVLMVLLSLWVLFGIIIPNTSGIVAGKNSKTLSEFQIYKKVKPTLQGNNENQKKIQLGEIKTYEEATKEFERYFGEIQDNINRLYANYDNSIKQLEVTTQNISRISPTALFRYSSENLSGTGLVNEDKFMRDIKAYSKIYDNYVLEKVGKLISTSDNVLMKTVTINGKFSFMFSPACEEYTGDKSDFPMFTESRPNVFLNLRNAMLDISGLLLWNIILAMGAFLAFNRADVR